MSNGQLDTMGYMVTFWKDEKLAWNGTRYDDIAALHLNTDDLWHPHIIQLDAMPEEVQLESLTILKDGTVLRVVIRKFYTFCELNMRYYPSDEHLCKFEFLSIKYAADELSLIHDKGKFGNLGVDTSILNHHGEWSVKETWVEKHSMDIDLGGIRTESIIYSLVLNRQSDFNVIHKFVPLGILGLSALFTHIVPLKCGERISYSVTLLLAFIFWQATVSEELPKNSSKISIFSFLLTSLLFLSSCVTIMSVTLCRIADLDPNRKIPKFLQKLSRKFRAKKKIQKKYQRQDSDLSNTYSNDDEKKNHNHVNGHATKKNIPVTMSKIVEDTRPVSWFEAANAIDMLLFIVHMIFVIPCTIAVILIFTLE